jgi:CubicO group peptidase (beta-lactamase class C family)
MIDKRCMDYFMSKNSFSENDINQVHLTLAKFPVNSQIAIAKVIYGKAYFYGAIKHRDIVSACENRFAVFDIGSIAKTFTTAMLAKLAVNQRLSLHTQISTILGVPLKNDAKITLLQLANHTSGLPRIPLSLMWDALFKDKENPYVKYNEDRLYKYLSRKVKLRKQGQFNYSNTGMGLLGLALSKSCGKEYEELLQELVCRRLGLHQTTTVRKNIESNLVQGLGTNGKPVGFWDMGAFLGAGGIYTSANDLANYVMEHLSEQNDFLNLQRDSTALIDKRNEIGLGWVLEKSESNKTYHFHDGASSGFSSVVGMNVKDKIGIVILSNISGFHLLKSGYLSKLERAIYSNIKHS